MGRSSRKVKATFLISIVPNYLIWTNLFVFFFVSLAATIKRHREDLLLDKEKTGEAISTEPPPHFFKKNAFYVEDIGEPTTACFLTQVNSDPVGW